MFKDKADILSAVDEFWKESGKLVDAFESGNSSPDVCIIVCATAIGRLLKVNEKFYEGDWKSDMMTLIQGAYDSQDGEKATLSNYRLTKNATAN